jgi:hypothetical protein
MHNCFRRTISGCDLRWREQQGPTVSSSRGNTSRKRHRSKATKDGGIKYDQLYVAGSAEDAESERRALGLRRKNRRKSSRPLVLSVSQNRRRDRHQRGEKAKAKKNVSNRQARRPRAAHRREMAARDTASSQTRVRCKELNGARAQVRGKNVSSKHSVLDVVTALEGGGGLLHT